MKKFIALFMSVCLAGSAFGQVTAKKTAALVVGGGDGQVNPGDTLRYTIVITNTSPTNLLNVQFADSAFSNQNFVAGSIKSTPIARPDSYTTVIGNTLFYVPAASGVLGNDSDPDGDAVTVVGFSATSAHGGTVTVTNNGGFAFLPPVGYQGSDTFTYTISDGLGGTNSSTVTLTISNMVWYVNNAAGGGDGRQNTPFNSFNSINGLGGVGDSDGTNDYIYLFQGNIAYVTGIRLENGQRLIGSGVPLVVNGTTVLPGGTRPTISASVSFTPAVLLAANNTIQGLNVFDFNLGRGITGTNVGNLFITNVTAGTVSGDAVVFIDTGTLDVTLDSASVTNSTDTGITLKAVTGSFIVNGGVITNCTGTDFVVVGGNATIFYPGNIIDLTGRAVDISGRTGGAITLSGNITNAGTGIIVQNCTGGTTAFSGASKGLNTGANPAVTLTSNTGHTINFSSGGLGIATTSGAGFSATGGGTIAIIGAGNVIDTTTGTALNVANTTIGGGGLTFQRISAGTAGSGPVNGIILNNTGAGFLSVLGTGAADSGGIIQRTDQGALFTSANNITLKSMKFLNANLGNGTGNNVDDATFNSASKGAINLSSVSGVVFDGLNMDTGVQNGINGQNVSNLTITNSTIQNFGDAVNECVLRLWNLTGTCAFRNSTFRKGGDFIADIRNSAGPLTLTIDGATFDDTDSAAFGAAGLSITSTGASPITNSIIVLNSTFTRIRNVGIQTFAKMTATMNIDFRTNTVDQLTAATGRAVEFAAAGTSHVNFNIKNNLKLYAKGGIAVNIAALNTAFIQGRVNNNSDIRCGGVGSPGTGVNLHPEDSSQGIFECNSNTISGIGSTTGTGITALSHGDGASLVAAQLDATIIGNTIMLTNNGLTGGSYIGGLFGIQVQAGSNAGDLIKTCGNVKNNAVTAAPLAINNSDNIAERVREGSSGSNLYLEGFNTSATTTWNNLGNTPANSVSQSLAGGAPPIAGPPAGSPYFGLCRIPSNP